MSKTNVLLCEGKSLEFGLCLSPYFDFGTNLTLLTEGMIPSSL